MGKCNRFFVVAAAGAVLLAFAAGTARADIIITVTENTSGGTNWAFSGGSGTLGTEGYNSFYPAETDANPQSFLAAVDNDSTLTVLSGPGSDNWDIYSIKIWSDTNHNASDANGFSGEITGDAIDILFTTAGGDGLDYANISDLNGLVVHADDFAYSSLNEGTYTLDQYWNANRFFYTSLGTVTLIVGDGASPVPEPSTVALLALGLTGLVWRRRRRTAVVLSD